VRAENQFAISVKYFSASWTPLLGAAAPFASSLPATPLVYDDDWVASIL